MARMPSLRRKILLGYAAFAILLVGVSLRALVDLRDLETQIEGGGRIGEFFDVTLEMRRFEKNFFLYRQAADLAQFRGYLARGRALLDENRECFTALSSVAKVSVSRESLDRYEAAMHAYAAHPEPAIAQAVRVQGMDIVGRAQQLAEAERRTIRQRIEQHRRELLLTLSALLVLLTASTLLVVRTIVRPLHDMETRMATIARGSTEPILATSADREIVSLAKATNHMLDELRRRQQQQLMQAERLASLGRLISGVAHEINNPLSNISGSAQILLEEEHSDPAWQRELLAQIDSETRRAQNIVRSLLDYARRREPQRKAIALRTAMTETLGFLRAELAPRISVRIDIPDGLFVAGDKARLQQAWFNLLRNAAEAIDAEGEIVIGAALAERDTVRITFRDSGRGIAPDVLPHIFEPFLSTREHGAGMGLFIVKEVVDEHGGRVDVQSTPGQGTQFTLDLPAALPGDRA